MLLARENILYTFAEHYADNFEVPAIPEYLIKIAKIVAWNIWQMDGIKFVVPNSCTEDINEQYDLFGDITRTVIPCPGCERNDHSKHNGIYCRIYDWPANRSVEFYSFIKKGALYRG